MDPSSFLEVEYGDDVDIIEDDGEPLTGLTEDDIVLLDNEYEEGGAGASLGSKRPPPNCGVPPPLKKIKKTNPAPAAAPGPKVQMSSKFSPHSPHLKPKHPQTSSVKTLQQQQSGSVSLLKSSGLTVTKRPSSSGAAPHHNTSHSSAVRPKLPQQSVTWKYRPLGENCYTADIKKMDMLRDYEPEKCNCKSNEEGTPCGSGCINRSTYSECEPGQCVNGDHCSNMVIQKRQYAPGLERFMTAKKGWGVRARQSIAKNSFILEYTGEICSKEEFEKRMLVRYRGDNHHYCLAMDNKMMIDAHRAGSECRFVNHSCAPNCEMQKWTVRGLPRMGLFALKDILPGEEICYDYNFSLFNSDEGQECKCGAKDCRGIIGGKNKDFLITLEGDDEVVNNKSSSNKTSQNSKPVAPSTRTVEDEKWFREKVSKEDMAWIEKNAPKPPQLEAKSLKCTVCNEYLDFKHLSQCQRHPDLGVLLCSRCKSQYGRGGWDKDKEGNDEFCRWCSEGGQIYLCDFCPHAFCNKCLRWNLGRKYLKSVEGDEKWKCLICDPSYLREHRATYWAIFKYHKDKKPKTSVNNSVSSPLRHNKSAPTPQVKNKTPAVNGQVRPNNSSSSQKPAAPSLNNITSVYKKLQENNFVTVRPVNKNQSKPGLSLKKNVVNGGRPDEPKHFLDELLSEADECVQQMTYMLTEVRKAWKLSGKKQKDVPVVAAKLRKALEMTKNNIDEVDNKVLKECLKEEVKSPSKQAVNGLHKKVDERIIANKKISKEFDKVKEESTEGINDISVDELEIAANVEDEVYNTPKKNSRTNSVVSDNEEDVTTKVEGKDPKDKTDLTKKDDLKEAENCNKCKDVEGSNGKEEDSNKKEANEEENMIVDDNSDQSSEEVVDDQNTGSKKEVSTTDNEDEISSPEDITDEKEQDSSQTNESKEKSPIPDLEDSLECSLAVTVQ